MASAHCTPCTPSDPHTCFWHFTHRRAYRERRLYRATRSVVRAIYARASGRWRSAKFEELTGRFTSGVSWHRAASSSDSLTPPVAASHIRHGLSSDEWSHLGLKEISGTKSVHQSIRQWSLTQRFIQSLSTRSIRNRWRSCVTQLHELDAQSDFELISFFFVLYVFICFSKNSFPSI